MKVQEALWLSALLQIARRALRSNGFRIAGGAAEPRNGCRKRRTSGGAPGFRLVKTATASHFDAFPRKIHQRLTARRGTRFAPCNRGPAYPLLVKTS